MKIKKLLLLIIVGIFCFSPMVCAKDDVVVKSINPIDSTDGIVLNSAKKIDVLFNDLGQVTQYKLVLKNNTKRDLYVNSLQIGGSSQSFMKYTLDENSRSKVIKANDEASVLVNIMTKSEKGAGKNLNDNISFKLLLNDKIENPNTNSNLISTIILVIISAVAITFVMTKFNNKKGTIATVIVCFMLLGTSFVFADDTVVVNFKGKVVYSSQNHLETTGTTILNHKANYTSSKDIWAYSNQVKNINISTENNSIETYAHTFDLTTNDKQRVKAYLVENSNQNVPYDLYIISNGVIYAPEDSTGLFSFPNVETINGLENVIFDNTVKMTGMFIGNEKLNKVNLSTIDTSKVKDTSYMFYGCYRLNVDENGFDLINVANKVNMFSSSNLYKLIKNNYDGINVQKYTEAGSDSFLNNVYYYRGNVTNNNVKFAGFCWKIVRTTETGGVKLIYNGIPNNDGSCDNTGTASQIGTSAFNLNYDSPAYTGYMYGKIYKKSEKKASEITAGIVYGNDIEYKDGKYYLKDTYISPNGWATDFTKISYKHHYTCFSTSDSCDKVNYIYYANESNNAYYFELTGGKTQLDILNEMLKDSTNEISSTIKNVIDTWYQNNMISYTKYLEDTVWCNDRSIYQLNGWDKDTQAVLDLRFGSFQRNFSIYNPSLECKNEADRFTIDKSNGNGNLTYPVALLTADELALAGASWGNTNKNFYLYTGENWWSLSSSYLHRYHPSAFILKSDGRLDHTHIMNSIGVRPAISLNSKVNVVSGYGDTTRPYVIE